MLLIHICRGFKTGFRFGSVSFKTCQPGVEYIFQQGFGSSVRQKKVARMAALPFALRRRVLVVISRKAVGFADNISEPLVCPTLYILTSIQLFGI